MNLPISFLLKKFITTLLLPPVLPWLILVAGLLLLNKRPRLGRVLAWGGLTLSIALSMPVVVDPLMAPLERFTVPNQAMLSSAQAVVILGGGMRKYAPEFGGSTVSYRTLQRVRYGAKLGRELKLPVLVTGGAPEQGPAEATVMAATLTQDFGITPQWVEGHSLNTHENATLSKPLLEKAGIHRIVLVTDAAHMRRAVYEFEAVGLEVIPAPTAFFTAPPEPGDTLGLQPNANSAVTAWYALHEWLGLLAQRVERLLQTLLH